MPKELGDFIIDVKCIGVRIAGSPYYVKVVRKKNDPRKLSLNFKHRAEIKFKDHKDGSSKVLSEGDAHLLKVVQNESKDGCKNEFQDPLESQIIDNDDIPDQPPAINVANLLESDATKGMYIFFILLVSQYTQCPHFTLGVLFITIRHIQCFIRN